MEHNCLIRADPSRGPSRGGLTGRVYPRLCGEYKRQREGGKPQKSRGKNSSEEAAGAWLRLVGSLRRTARAWGFSHHENPLAKAGCPSSSIGAVAAGGAARKEHIIYLHTSRRAPTYLRAGKAQPRSGPTRGEKEQRSVSQVNHQKFCRHRTGGPLERLIV